MPKLDVTVATIQVDAVKDLPAGMRIYCVGDIHGCSDLLSGLLRCIDHHHANYPVTKAVEVHLGDMIDRGHDSKGVLDLLSEVAPGRERILLRGNHEQRLLDLIDNPADTHRWLYEGGYECLQSYGAPKELLNLGASETDIMRHLQGAMGLHLQLVAGTKLTCVIGPFLFVHAGVDPLRPLNQQTARDLLFMREPFLSHTARWEKLVIHGHTPNYDVTRGPHRIGIDTGAFATGRLTCLVLQQEGAMTITVSLPARREQDVPSAPP